MARAKLSILNLDEIERINAISIRILENIGVSIRSKSVCKLLERYGCIPSKNGKRMLIPENVVKQAVSSAPKSSILLAARDKKYDMMIPSDKRTYMANGGEGVYVKNLLTGESHSSTLKDTIDFFILSERMPQVDFVWVMVGAIEQPPHVKELAEMRTCYEHTNKHLMGGALSAEQAKDMIDIASILSGGRDEMEKRPIYSAVQCPISPLTFEKGIVEGQVELARAKVPVVAMSAPIAGITSPVTLSGTVAQTTAENLASLVIVQAARKGAPFIFSSDSSTADMSTGSIDYGGMESPLLHSACGQMGRFYCLPTMCNGASIEEASIYLGNVQEGVPLMFPETLIQSDLGSGFGGIDNALGASLEQFMVDAWVWDLAREFARTFDTDEDAISYETIQKVAEGSSYLSQVHTIKRFKKEIISATRPEMSPIERDKLEKRGSLIKKAQKEAIRILKEPRKSLLAKDESKELESFFSKFK